MFARLDAGTVETAHEGSVSLGEISIFAVLEGFNEYGAAVDFDHDHDVLMAGLGVSAIEIRSNLERGSTQCFRSCKTHPRLTSQDSRNDAIVESKS